MQNILVYMKCFYHKMIVSHAVHDVSRGRQSVKVKRYREKLLVLQRSRVSNSLLLPIISPEGRGSKVCDAD